MMNSRKSDIRFQRRLGIGMLVAGVLALVAGAFVFVHSQQFYRSAIRARGEIVEVERRQFQKDVTLYPVFSFQDKTGAKHVVHSKFGYASNRFVLSRRYAIGDAVEVIYAADEPESARLNDSWSMWGWTIVFGVGGFLLASAGIVLWHGAARWKREAGL